MSGTGSKCKGVQSREQVHTPLSSICKEGKGFSPLTLNCLLTLFLNMTPLHIYVHTHVCAHAHTHIQFLRNKCSISSQSPREYSQSKPWHWYQIGIHSFGKQCTPPMCHSIVLDSGIQTLVRWTCCFYEAYRHGEGWVSMKADCKVEGENASVMSGTGCWGKRREIEGKGRVKNVVGGDAVSIQVQANDSLPQYLSPWTQKTIWKPETE